MDALKLHQFHEGLNAAFLAVNEMEAVAHYGDSAAEYRALKNAAGVLDLSFRSRLCLLGADRLKFINGQVTNDVKNLTPGRGCYAALITAKGRMETDLNIYCLENEILLDFEPGLTASIFQRLEKYIIADDVEVADVSPMYGLLSIQGPDSARVVGNLGPALETPAEPYRIVWARDDTLGQVYLANTPRIGSAGFDLFAPMPSLGAIFDKLIAGAKEAGGAPCGWQALEVARIEAGIPRFGADMDETNLPPEAGLESRAVSYTKGCYIGQEVIARIRTYGQVAKTLRGLRLSGDLKVLPAKGDKLLREGKEVGYITSATRSPAVDANIALGYVRRGTNEIGTELAVRTGGGEAPAKIVELPFG